MTEGLQFGPCWHDRRQHTILTQVRTVCRHSGLHRQHFSSKSKRGKEGKCKITGGRAPGNVEGWQVQAQVAGTDSRVPKICGTNFPMDDPIFERFASEFGWLVPRARLGRVEIKVHQGKAIFRPCSYWKDVEKDVVTDGHCGNVDVPPVQVMAIPQLKCDLAVLE